MPEPIKWAAPNADFLAQWRGEGLKREILASVVPQTANDDQRTIDVCWFSGAEVDRYSWSEGSYKMRFDPAGADLSLLNNGAPVCDNHCALSLACQLGRVDKAWEDSGKFYGTLRFPRSTELTGPRPEADCLWQDLKDKIVSKFSMGVEILACTDERDKDNKLVLRTVTSWRPFEISIAPIPADFDTTTLSAEPQPAPAQPEASLASQQSRASAQKETPMEITDNTAGDQARVDNAAALTAARDEAIRLERVRATAIQTLAKPFIERGQISAEFVNGLAAEGLSVEQVGAKLLDKLANTSEETQIRGNHNVQFGADARDKCREGMTAALLYRAEPEKFASLRDSANQFRSLTLMDMARLSLENAGVRTASMSREEIAQGALRNPVEFPHYFSGAITTSDLPNVLANTASKSLLMAYEAAAPTFKSGIARQVGVADYKTATAVNLSDIGTLDEVKESGEFTTAPLSDKGEPYRVRKYGRIVSVSDVVIVNDDLNTLVRIPASMGVAAAQTESNVFWSVVTANANMSDGKPIFHADHANLGTGANSAFSETSLATTREKMRLQTAPKGTLMNLTPRFIVAPAALENTVLKYLAPLQLAASSAANVLPQWITNLIPVIEPRLDAASATAWYGVANGDGMIYCYLNGNEGVKIETKNGFEIDGLQIKATMVFGAAAVEYRTWRKNNGA